MSALLPDHELLHQLMIVVAIVMLAGFGCVRAYRKVKRWSTRKQEIVMLRQELEQFKRTVSHLHQTQRSQGIRISGLEDAVNRLKEKL